MQVHVEVIVAKEQAELSGADVGRSAVDRRARYATTALATVPNLRVPVLFPTPTD